MTSSVGLAVEAFEAGLAAAEPSRAVRLALGAEDRRWPAVLAVGKASLGMLEGAAEWLDEESPGVVVTTAGQAGQRAAVLGVEVFGAGHPVPDAVGLSASVAVEELLRGGSEELLVLISGGASALLPAPAAGVGLADKIATTQALLASGASIHEVNAVRKHLSRFKGGGLAELAEHRRSTVLILSDVPGDDLSVVGSGPFTPDPSTFADAVDVLDRYAVAVPGSASERLKRGAAGDLAETPFAGAPCFAHVDQRLVGGNAASVAACAEVLSSRGEVVTKADPVEGEARSVGQRLAAEVVDSGAGLAVCGGETTVTLRGDGLGGRNQELALAFALAMENLVTRGDWAFLSAGTDGRDGPTDAAGAVVTAETIARGGGPRVARAALDANDSYRFLEAAGGLLVTGETGTNVADLQVWVDGAVLRD
ncbi:MAG: DUF4147 domain-containing protein [Acidobacteriota bacterium]